ncbi:transposase [Streptomyces syringium]|uniref:Transposase n=1 Tax=Streptomyces syringium TaxID=76729 RepID=A0ABS4XYJ9_9ACTN|nr:transposase [Streptomyces syringium]
MHRTSTRPRAYEPTSKRAWATSPPAPPTSSPHTPGPAQTDAVPPPPPRWLHHRNRTRTHPAVAITWMLWPVRHCLPEKSCSAAFQFQHGARNPSTRTGAPLAPHPSPGPDEKPAVSRRLRHPEARRQRPPRTPTHQHIHDHGEQRLIRIAGTWAGVLEELQVGVIEWEVFVDWTMCRAHQHAAGRGKMGSRSGPDALELPGGRAGRPHARAFPRGHEHQAPSTWRRMPPATSGQSQPPAEHGDAPQFTRLRSASQDGQRTPTHPALPRDRRPRVSLARDPCPPAPRADPGEARPGRPPAPPGLGGRPPGFDREAYKHRHKVECRIGLLKQARGVATRHDKLAVHYETAVQLTLRRQSL